MRNNQSNGAKKKKNMKRNCFSKHRSSGRARQMWDWHNNFHKTSAPQILNIQETPQTTKKFDSASAGWLRKLLMSLIHHYYFLLEEMPWDVNWNEHGDDQISTGLRYPEVFTLWFGLLKLIYTAERFEGFRFKTGKSCGAPEVQIEYWISHIELLL